MEPSAGSCYEINSWGGLKDLVSRNVCILTFGCTYNHGDSRKLENILKAQGCRIVPTPEEADALVLNTCTVVGPTERKMIRILKKYRAMALYVTGCMPLVQQEDIFTVCTPVFIHPDSIREEHRNVTCRTRHEVGIVQIGKGCIGSCTYCITRNARGFLVNHKEGEILQEIQECHSYGATEIQLCAQDCSAWKGEKDENLGDLLSKTREIPGSFLLRIGMMNPATLLPILDPVIESLRDERIFNFVHLPVQSGSDRILSKMGRGYTSEDFMMIAKEFRAKIPDISIATDIIAGFPGEDEGDVQTSIDLLSAVMPAKVNITRYSPRPHTLASGKGDLTDYAKKVRSRRLQRHAEKLYHLQNQSMLGKTIGVTVTEHIRPGSVLCRSSNYTGVVVNKDLAVGKKIQVRIIADRMYFFSGEPVI
ncbi:MAG: radical SAM protein [Methanoregulaceae archaeon]|nr:radical SAM protein [Methanoregulaceae archaeon]